MFFETDFMKLYEELSRINFDISNNIMESDVPLKEAFTQANNLEAMDKAIQEHFGQDEPGDGCVFIAPNGKFLNIYPELDDHESLAYWLQEHGFEEVIEEAEWFVEAFNYVRCRNSLSQCFIELPIKTITKYQLYSLEEWLETKVNTPTLDIEAPNGEWKNYDLDEYFPEDIIKLIKRCYASGRLYESQAKIDYLPVSDVELFKEYADDILDGYGNMSDPDIKSSIKEIHSDGKLAGYIGFSEYEENGNKCLGIGNFMIIERGKGLGSAVIQNIVEKYKNQYDLIYCFVDAKNEGAIRLYKKLGKVYDEDGPNDNGEYYVTFYDNGNWELNEGKKNKKVVAVNTTPEIDFDSFLREIGLVPISEITPACSNTSSTGAFIWAPAKPSTGSSYTKAIPHFDIICKNRLSKLVASLDDNEYPTKIFSTARIQNNGDRKLMEVRIGEVNNCPCRGLWFRAKSGDKRYFIFGDIFYKNTQKINASSSHEVAFANKFYDAVIKKLETH